MRFRSKKTREVPLPQPHSDPSAEFDDIFDTMVSALDWYFHVTSCREHTDDERREAFAATRDSYAGFSGDDLANEVNAPTR